MKKIDEDLLAELEQYAGLMFTKKEIAAILEFSLSEFEELLDHDDDAYKRFQRGRLKKDAEVRKSIFDLAANGSSPAQSFAWKLIENAKMDDL